MSAYERIFSMAKLCKRHTISLYKKIIIYACILALKNSNVKISTEWQDTNMILKSFLYVNDLFAKNI